MAQGEVTLTLSTDAIRALRMVALMEGRSVDQMVEALAAHAWREWFGSLPVPAAPARKRRRQPMTDFELELAARYPCRKCQAEGR